MKIGNRAIRIAQLVAAAGAGACFVMAAPSNAAVTPPSHTHSITLHTPKQGCVWVDTDVKGWPGMPYWYSMIYCGPHIIDQLVTCPSALNEQPMYPAVVFNCTVKYYPHGFGAWAHPPVPGGY